ncbi:primosomal protein N' [Tissierella sp. MB52-C2]|uniref:primosomal protein N' n=1 Tax=Tissierella sp. MB52-C2 TaxID=3070999 RepID=UPI00280C03DA|nr:primosomal protein N' [Tissierella sp. MB52-C2]WMM26757.1 primosomal protein N' [Tissierella sp. MB52-C2]
MNVKYAQIIVNNKSSQVDRPYTYIVEGELQDIVKEGMRVIIPFGRGNKLIKGIVIKILDNAPYKSRLKKVVDVLDDKPLISKELIELSIWMKEYYLSSYLDAFQPVLPPGDFKEINTFIELVDKKIDNNVDEEEAKIISYLRNKGKILLEDCKKDLRINNINKLLNDLESKDIIETTIDVKTTVEKRTEKWVKILDTNLSLLDIYDNIGTRATKQREIMEYIFETKDVSFKDLSRKVNTTLSTVRLIEKKGLITVYDKEISRDPIKKDIKYYKKHDLSLSQKKIFNKIIDSIENKSDRNKFLIHGVTGSGKTEIYLQLVEEMLKVGRDSIILVPEISLTPQTIDRFVGRFGDLVAVLHSKLSYGERFDEWRKIKEGRVKIVVGARSAVFAPFKNLGIIIIDEEHEATYKSSQNPKYNTIEVAERRVDLENGTLILGSATPSLETYYESLNGRFTLLELEERINNYKLPKVVVIDMRDELNKGNKSIFSTELYDSIDENLKKGQQTILFLNRRGFSTFVSCRSCGYVVKCNDCDISMTYHRNINKLRCHYCGLSINPPNICPVCKSEYIRYFGIGTEKVEEIAKELFPQARIARMDMDTTSKKGSHERILENMKDGNIDILIGTQMISKGLDFKNVTLVGIIAADTTLNLPDFRAPEKAFQLVTQVAGRAGRGEESGRVILQTYEPEHYSIEFSKDHDYKEFYNTEISLRKAFLYPPFLELVSLLIWGEDNNKVATIAKEVYNLIIENIDWVEKDNINNYIIGPYPAPLERIKNNYRWQILLKSKKENINSLKYLLKKICIENEYKLKIDDVKISIDIDPNSIL